MKVGVIADDLSGAAELAGAAADMGYSAEVHTAFEPGGGAEVVAVDTDSRTMPAPAAAHAVEAVTRDLLRAGAAWVYKKTDSVLRGNVRAELEAAMSATALRRALLVPANPSKRRVIRGGIYYVDGAPLARSAFAHDPSHPRRSSAVAELLGEPVAHHAREDRIAVPDVEDAAGLRRLAEGADDEMLVGGAVEFFQAILERREGKRVAATTGVALGPPGPILFVCGSAHAWSRGRPNQCERHGIPVLAMPEAVRSASSCAALREWADSIRGTLAQWGRAMVAIGGGAPGEATPPQSATLADTLAQALSMALDGVAVSLVCVEGGATAAALLRTLGWTRLGALPSPGLAGVAVLRPAGRPGPLVLVKPGSYPWPEQLWHRPAPERDS